MIDALTGETNLEEPVISRTGHVFEKRIIEKYLRDNNNKCPITDEDLNLQDLISIKVNKIVKPRPPTATSVPGLLQLFQNEWDALMLESFTLKQQLDSTRQELSHALYQHDAACRVIARLIKERDEAKNALANLEASGATTKKDTMEIEGSLPEDVSSAIQSKSTQLSSTRRKRAISSNLATVEDMKSYKAQSSHPIHSSSPAGILCVDIKANSDLIVTGGADSAVVLFDKSTKKVVNTLKGHTKQVNEVLFHSNQDIFLSASADKTVRVWTGSNGSYQSAHVIKSHKEEVTGVSFQATGEYFASGSLDGFYGFHDLASGSTLTQVNVEDAIRSLKFHPDGLLLGTAIKNNLAIWDIRSSQKAATFEGHKGSIADVAFSENGYHLSTASDDNTIKVWDLRKLKLFHSFEVPKTFSASSVAWDYTGLYLAATGNSEIRVYSVGKAPEEVVTLTGHTGVVTDVKFGTDAQWFASTSMDRNLKIWSK